MIEAARYPSLAEIASNGSSCSSLEADTIDLSPRELALRFTDEKRNFVSQATVYRLLKANDLITSPAYAVLKADVIDFSAWNQSATAIHTSGGIDVE